ncbi:SGNH hydrolase-type esterase domain-containing protein [Cercophora newfieldiana]|uniref:SGNH hydrolase-type esterase domain-containing protein n=1 Tax=Cercophora newfieldiana TaxID=92897 RepID=A0AA39YH65_9PEZI|nr:SGNH hydrolase-type esterase domain-containing protein [Cercophora newfieldiana]
MWSSVTMRQSLGSVAASLLLLSSWVTAAPSVQDEKRDVILQAREGEKWVATWTSMPQLVESNNMPPSPFSSGGVFKDATLRQTLHMSIGADRIRIQISNTFGGSDLPITAATIALPTGGKAGVSGIDASTVKPLTFNNGAESVKIARGQVVYTDPIDFKIAPQSMITISLYSQPGQSGSSITGHPGSRTTSWMQAGNRVKDATMSGSSTKHWYFVSAVEAWAPSNASALIILGDSITDGRGSTDDANNRWPDLLLARMQKAGITHIGVNNQAAGGNTVLSGGLGPPLMQRYKRDALSMQGVKYVMLFIGVNDIGNSGGGVASQLQNAFKTVVADCKKAGFVTIGATVTAFGGQGQSYSSPAREQQRQQLNQWILTSGTFDHTVDFAKIVDNPSRKDQLASQYDGGDHLHPNVAGFQAMADGFPLDIFK